MDMDMESTKARVVRNILFREKVKLEMAHGVCIYKGAVVLACDIVGRDSDVQRAYIDLSSSSSTPSYSSSSSSSSRLALSYNGKGGMVNNLEVMLQKKAVELLEKACGSLRHDLVTNEEEPSLDMAEYLLDRTRVELNEIRKEKDYVSQIWIPRVEVEYRLITSLWDRVLVTWMEILTFQQIPRRRLEDICMLKQVHRELLQRLELEATQKKVPSSEEFQKFGATLTELLRRSCESFKRKLVVGPDTVAKVASPMTGIPVSWLLNSLKPPLKGLREKLANSLVGQNHVVNAITSALLRPRPDGSGPRPIRSFLFLGSHLGSSNLFTVLAKHIFDSEYLVIRFDMSEFRDLHSVRCDSCVLNIRSRDYNHEEHGVGGKLIEAVKNRPYCVLLFENVDKANDYAINIILDILRHGGLIDSQGNKVDFTKSLIIMTSDVGVHKLRPSFCNCLQKFPSRPMKDWHQVLTNEHVCGFIPVFKEAKKRFKGALLEQLDDVIVFVDPSLLQYNAIARLQLRNLADSVKQNGLIVYPSEAALRNITVKSSCTTVGGAGLRTWLEKNVAPVLLEMLSENKINAMPTIYIDVLVGTDELSYRMENSRGLVGDDVFNQFKESLIEFKHLYLKEKEYNNKIYTLWRAYVELITKLDSQNIVDPDDVALVVQRLGYMVDDLINTAKTSVKLDRCKLAPVKSLYEETKSSQREQAGERAGSELEGLKTILYGNFEGKCPAIDVVLEATWRSIDAPNNLLRHPAKTFLFLGLTCIGKADLVKGLAELLCTDDGAQMVTQINMQEYSDPDSFFGLMDGAFGFPLHEQHGLALREAVKTRPYRVVLLDQVEKAEASVFSALLSVLDHGTWRCNDGRVVNLCRTIVIIMSDLGNKRILASLVGHASHDTVQEGDLEQGARPFRFELLNRIDEIVIFNPSAREQLRESSRLPLGAGSHLGKGSNCLHPPALSSLFSRFSDPFVERSNMESVVSQLSKRLIGSCKNVVLSSRRLIGSCSNVVLSSRSGFSGDLLKISSGGSSEVVYSSNGIA